MESEPEKPWGRPGSSRPHRGPSAGKTSPGNAPNSCGDLPIPAVAPVTSANWNLAEDILGSNETVDCWCVCNVLSHSLAVSTSEVQMFGKCISLRYQCHDTISRVISPFPPIFHHNQLSPLSTSRPRDCSSSQHFAHFTSSHPNQVFVGYSPLSL